MRSAPSVRRSRTGKAPRPKSSSKRMIRPLPLPPVPTTAPPSLSIQDVESGGPSALSASIQELKAQEREDRSPLLTVALSLPPPRPLKISRAKREVEKTLASSVGKGKQKETSPVEVRPFLIPHSSSVPSGSSSISGQTTPEISDPINSASPTIAGSSRSSAIPLEEISSNLSRNGTTATMATLGHKPYLPFDTRLPAPRAGLEADADVDNLLPRAGYMEDGDTIGKDLLRRLRQSPDRQHKLMQLASSISTMRATSRLRISLIVDRDSSDSLSNDEELEEGPGVEVTGTLLPATRSTTGTINVSMSSDVASSGKENSSDSRRAIPSKETSSITIPTQNCSQNDVPTMPPQSPSAKINDNRWLLPKLVLPGIGIVEDIPKCQRDQDMNALSSPVEFLNSLSPWKRQMVFNIMNTLARVIADARRREKETNSDNTDSQSESDSGHGRDGYNGSDEEGSGSSVEDSIRTTIRDMSREYAKKTGTIVMTPALIGRFTTGSKKWVKEKNGRRWVEEDYSNVLEVLRRL